MKLTLYDSRNVVVVPTHDDIAYYDMKFYFQHATSNSPIHRMWRNYTTSAYLFETTAYLVIDRNNFNEFIGLVLDRCEFDDQFWHEVNKDVVNSFIAYLMEETDDKLCCCQTCLDNVRKKN